ncbi:hypothetical protein BIY20_11655 [Vibrio panuliri]|uniref:CSD domain-containing protein n=1 Tax=Vibrio panuliri TaxID=1381081 RepID=A0ABX3FCU1_9VIBR|nr:hypothetical protein BIY20_11655 [Vibrio panuliri]
MYWLLINEKIDNKRKDNCVKGIIYSSDFKVQDSEKGHGFGFKENSDVKQESIFKFNRVINKKIRAT